jgi:hypothetical protein
MRSGSSDHQIKPAAPEVSGGRYSAVSFVAMAVNVLALDFLTWVYLLAWYMIPVLVLPVVITDAVIAWGLTRGRGAIAQVGRGMLIGCIVAPLTVVIFTAVWAIAHLLGPV